MARLSLVIDASVAVKWFSAAGEGGLSQALDILELVEQDNADVLIPDLFYYEVANALVHKRVLSESQVQTAVSNLFSLDLKALATDSELLREAAQLARQLGITVYDASYGVVARNCGCPLVTANPRHQKGALGCQVIPLERFNKGSEGP